MREIKFRAWLGNVILFFIVYLTSILVVGFFIVIWLIPGFYLCKAMEHYQNGYSDAGSYWEYPFWYKQGWKDCTKQTKEVDYESY